MPDQQITINVPVEKAFDYLADITRHSEWAEPQHRLEVEKTSDGPVGQGSTFKSVGHQFGRDIEETVTITEYVTNERFAYRVDGNVAQFRHWFELQPADGGAQVAKGFERLKVLKPSFRTRLLGPLIAALVVPRMINGDLQRIKAKLEGEATA